MLISIIMPVYNAENTLNKTVNSVLSQAFQDFELIAIDDGSNDSSPSLLSQMAKHDKRIRVITIKNSGPSNARNIGLKSANGDYIMFIDSDDELVPGALERIEALIKKDKQVELFIFGFVITDSCLTPINTYSVKDINIQTKQDLGKNLSYLYINNMLNQVWNKVYNTHLLRNNCVLFCDYNYGEDRLFVFDVLNNTCKVSVISDLLYFYKMNTSGSLITNFYDKKFESCLLIDERIRHIAAEYGSISQDDTAVYDYMFIKSVVSCMTQLYHPSCSLSRRDKRLYVNSILIQLNNRRFIHKGFGFEYFLITYFLHTRIVFFNSVFAYFTYRLSRSNPRFFIRKKHFNKKG